MNQLGSIYMGNQDPDSRILSASTLCKSNQGLQSWIVPEVKTHSCLIASILAYLLRVKTRKRILLGKGESMIYFAKHMRSVFESVSSLAVFLSQSEVTKLQVNAISKTKMQA